MTRPYSMDLRDRAIARVVAGESVRSVLSIGPQLVSIGRTKGANCQAQLASDCHSARAAERRVR
jgi:hypothetical protein